MTRVIKADWDNDNNIIHVAYAGGHIVTIPLSILEANLPNLTPASESRLT